MSRKKYSKAFKLRLLKKHKQNCVGYHDGLKPKHRPVNSDNPVTIEIQFANLHRPSIKSFDMTLTEGLGYRSHKTVHFDHRQLYLGYF